MQPSDSTEIKDLMPKACHVQNPKELSEDQACVDQ